MGGVGLKLSRRFIAFATNFPLGVLLGFCIGIALAWSISETVSQSLERNAFLFFAPILTLLGVAAATAVALASIVRIDEREKAARDNALRASRVRLTMALAEMHEGCETCARLLIKNAEPELELVFPAEKVERILKAFEETARNIEQPDAILSLSRNLQLCIAQTKSFRLRHDIPRLHLFNVSAEFAMVAKWAALTSMAWAAWNFARIGETIPQINSKEPGIRETLQFWGKQQFEEDELKFISRLEEEILKAHFSKISF